MPTMVEEAREATTVRRGGTVSVGTFRLERDEAGLKIKMKSEMLEKFFKGLSTRTEVMSDGKKYYNLRRDISQDQLYMSLDSGETVSFVDVTQQIVSGSTFYLWIFRLEGLKDGIEMTFPGIYSTPQLKNLHKAIKAAMSYLYLNFIKSYKTSCDLQTVEFYHVDGVRQ